MKYARYHPMALALFRKGPRGGSAVLSAVTSGVRGAFGAAAAKRAAERSATGAARPKCRRWRRRCLRQNLTRIFAIRVARNVAILRVVLADLARSSPQFTMRVASHPAARAAHPGCRARGARGARSPRPRRRLLRARAAETAHVDPADGDARARDDPVHVDDVPAALRAWCASTRGGVDATVADIDALRRLVACAETASGGSDSESSYADATWRLLGASQRTEPSPGSWLASPFFWFAKEAQHESYALASDIYDTADDATSGASGLMRVAARLSAGWDDPKTGEQWVSAFGARRATAAFPFSLVEGLLNFFRVPFESGEATVRVVTNDTDASTGTLESRVRVRFGDEDGGDVFSFSFAGELVTRCALETTERAKKAKTNANERVFVVRLVSTAFENFGDPPGVGSMLSSVVVPSGAVMGALMAPSDRLRKRNDASGKPGVPYRVNAFGDVAVAVAGASEATQTILVYERA